MNLFSEIWNWRYVATEACSVIVMITALVLSIIAIWIAAETRITLKRILRQKLKEQYEKKD